MRLRLGGEGTVHVDPECLCPAGAFKASGMPPGDKYTRCLSWFGHRSEDLGESEFLGVLEHQLSPEQVRRQVRAVLELAASLPSSGHA